MEKRVYITIDDAYKAVDKRIDNLKLYHRFTKEKEIDVSGVKTQLWDMPKFTEQEIVKPYLEKLKNKFFDCCDSRIGVDTEITIFKVLQLIDNLLSEQGDTE